MWIHVCDWAGEGVLEKTAYCDSRKSEPFEGTREDALRVATELFDQGLDVMLCRPHLDGEDIDIWVDDRAFQPRIFLP